jgi:hypothetical protein
VNILKTRIHEYRRSISKDVFIDTSNRVAMGKRMRRIGSVKKELIEKSKEAMLSAIQVYNNPNILFKSETFIVLAIISWTYLMHAYYRSMGIDYRYFEFVKIRKRYIRTKYGAYKHWELENCLNCSDSPLDEATTQNLKFLIGLRHEIEHQKTDKIDDLISSKLQACCLNYNHYLKKLFGEPGLETSLRFSIQFSKLSLEQKEQLEKYEELPEHIQAYIKSFEENLLDETYQDDRFRYRVAYVPINTNNIGKADRVVEFIPPDSKLAKRINKGLRVLVKERERPKHLPSQIVDKMRELGYVKFGMHQHTELWKKLKAKDSSKGYGTLVAGKQWLWYDQWLELVKKHCENNKDRYRR